MNREIENITILFHDTYEELAKEYGYKTREDTKVFDMESPNGKTMFKTVEKIITPYLEEIERLKEENLLLRASEPMSKLQEDYGYKARIDKAIEYIEEQIKKYQDFKNYSHEQCYRTGAEKIAKEVLQILDKGETK